MKRLLIANRGEIALRIIRTCRSMGVESVAIFSDADEGSPFVTAADHAVAVGGRETFLDGPRIIDTALRINADAIHPGYGFLAEQAAFAEAVLQAGLRFVGPRPETIRIAGSKDAARTLAASLGVPIPRGAAPQSPGESGDPMHDELLAAACGLRYPLLVKAAAGGGGRGMRLVHSSAELEQALAAASREALNAFGDGTLILEEFIEHARHIEVQIFGDSFGTVEHLFERDCSFQRRYQKVIEEAPARALPQPVREELYRAAVTIGKGLNLISAATVEFLVPQPSPALAGAGQGGDQAASAIPPFLFLEINPRIQVEHPVTEAILGIDLVEWQIRIARGEPIPLSPEPRKPRGHALEARVCAENPHAGFLPQTGRIELFIPPSPFCTVSPAPTAHLGASTADEVSGSGVRIRCDHSLRSGMTIGTDFDSLLAKVISHGESFDQAHAGLLDALEHFAIGGVETNIPFLRSLLRSDLFGTPERISTRALEDHLDSLLHAALEPERVSAMVACYGVAEVLFWRAQTLKHWEGDARDLIDPRGLFYSAQIELILSTRLLEHPIHFGVLSRAIARGERPNSFVFGYTLNQRPIPSDHEKLFSLGTPMVYEIEVHPDSLHPHFLVGGDGRRAEEVRVITGGIDENESYRTVLWSAGHQLRIERLIRGRVAPQSSAGDGAEIRAPLPGTILRVHCAPQTAVNRGDLLLVFESMKMEHSVYSPLDGVVQSVAVAAGNRVQQGTLLLALSPHAESS